MTTRTTTLTDFLLSRIGEDETAARAASVGSESWHLGEYDETVLWWAPSPPEKVAFIRERMGDDAADRDASWSGQTVEIAGDRIAPHIALHDPSRVLAECEAKRRIIKEHSAQEVASLDAETRGQVFLVCRRCAENMRQVVVPCPTLRLLALPYTDHPDFDESWRP